MSLLKQLWLAIASLMITAFSISFAVSTLTAKTYLEEQLYLKNLDNAASLALSMNQLPKEPTLIELQLSAQFDTGHYQRIQLTSPTGEVLVERTALNVTHHTPDWFKTLINIQVAPGTGTVMDGWTVYGTVQLESQISYAYDTLWQSTLNLLLIFSFAALIIGLLGSLVLKVITNPLDNVVEQAEAIGERRFITNHEPKTLEFKQLVRSMNLLSNRIKGMLESETQRLEQIRQKLQMDGLTGLFNRETFMSHLKSALTEEELNERGFLLIARIEPLGKINQEIGHNQTDELIVRIASQLRQITKQYPSWKASRLNGSDFALLICDQNVDVQQLIQPLINLLLEAQYTPIKHLAKLPVGVTHYQKGESVTSVMIRLDACLAQSEHVHEPVFDIESKDAAPSRHFGLSEWRESLSIALSNLDNVSLGRFNVRDTKNALLHIECPVRLTVYGEEQRAGSIFPWISRLNWHDRIDLLMVKKAITQLKTEQVALGINISAESLQSNYFREGLLDELLHLDLSLTSLLWIEIPERGVYQNLESFKRFCLAIKPFACKIGLEHAGEYFSRIAELNDLGLDYYKINTNFIRDIDQNTNNQTFIQGVITVAHAIGLLVIAEGVSNESETSCLISLGIDGLTGPGVL